jgi:hypothetical protein
MWGADGSVVYNCTWSSPAQSFSGPSPMGLVTIFYCLRLETSLFVASYDSQGYGGGIQPRLSSKPPWSPLASSYICQAAGIKITSLKNSVFRIRGRSLSLIRCHEKVLIETLANKQLKFHCWPRWEGVHTCYLGNDGIRCNERVISDPLLNNGLLCPAPLFRLSAVTLQYVQRTHEADFSNWTL